MSLIDFRLMPRNVHRVVAPQAAPNIPIQHIPVRHRFIAHEAAAQGR